MRDLRMMQRVCRDPMQREHATVAVGLRFRAEREARNVGAAQSLSHELAPDGLNAGLLGEYDAWPAALGPEALDGLNAGLLGEYDTWPPPCPEAPEGLNAGLLGE